MSSASAVALALASGLLWPASSAQAACTPVTGVGTPSGATITCSGATTNQDGTTGYGTGQQNNNTVNVQTNATVTGTDNGFFLGNGNTINLATGTSVIGGLNGMVIGTGTTTINNNNGGTISGSSSGSTVNGISMSSGTLIVTNTGTMSGTATTTGAGIGINSSGDVTVSSNTGTISGTAQTGGNEAVGIQGANITIQSNSGTISGTGANTVNGSFGIFGLTTVTVNQNTGMISGTLEGIAALGTTNITNNVGGQILGTGATGSVGIIVQAAGPVTLVNSGNVAGSVNGINTATSALTTITNNAGGVISSVSGGATPGAIRVNTANITNAGTVTGDIGVMFRNGNAASQIFDSGTITGTGGTAIHFSTGSVGNALTLGAGFAINGTVAGAGSDILQLGGTGTGTFNLSNIGTQYQGFTTFNKIGTSTWTVTGTGTQPWTVQAGTFLVDGSTSGAVTVAGGTLGGTGAVGTTTIASGATLSPGHGGIGTLTVNGNLTLQSGSNYLVDVSAATSGKTAVTGTASLNGNATAVFQGSLFQSQYVLLTAAGGRSGTFSTFTTLNLPTFLTASLVYTGTDVDLTLTSTLGQTPALTPNQAAVANSLDQALASGGGFLGGLAGLSPGQLPAAFNALSGEGLSGVQETAFGAGGMFIDTLMDVAEDWLNGGGDGPQARAYSAMGYAAEGSKAAVFKAMPFKAPAYVPTWRTWLAGFDGTWKLNGEANPGSADLTHRTAGGVAGIDHQVTPDVLIGMAGGGSASNFSVPDRATSGTLDGAHVGVYGVARQGGWYAAATATFAAFSNKTSRTIAGVGPTEIANASFDSDLWGGRFEAGFKSRYGAFAVTPFAAVQAAQLRIAGFTESSTTVGGAPGVLGLTVPSRTVNSLPTFLGVQFDDRITLSNAMTWIPYARVAWVHEFDPNRDISASFITLPAAAFTVDGPRAARDAARVDAGSKLRVSRNVSLFESFDGEFSSRSRMYSGKGGVMIEW